MSSQKKVLFMMADYGHDPTEVSVPYTALKNAGFDVEFATENGNAPQCDKLLLEGLTQKLLGAKKTTIQLHETMTASPEWQNPLAWTAPDFSLDPYSLLVLPGGHEKRMRQILDSEAARRLVAAFFPQTRKDKDSNHGHDDAASGGSGKAVAAICHGVVLLAEAKRPADGRSVICECATTALPAGFESVAFWGTRLFMGDYYKTYGAGSENVEATVRKNLIDDKKQWKSSLGMSPFVVEDDNYNYISARFPGDAQLFAEKAVALVKSFQ